MDRKPKAKLIERTNEINMSADLIKMRQSWQSMNKNGGATEAQWNVTQHKKTESQDGGSMMQSESQFYSTQRINEQNRYLKKSRQNLSDELIIGGEKCLKNVADSEFSSQNPINLAQRSDSNRNLNQDSDINSFKN